MKLMADLESMWHKLSGDVPADMPVVKFGDKAIRLAGLQILLSLMERFPRKKEAGGVYASAHLDDDVVLFMRHDENLKPRPLMMVSFADMELNGLEWVVQQVAAACEDSTETPDQPASTDDAPSLPDQPAVAGGRMLLVVTRVPHRDG